MMLIVLALSWTGVIDIDAIERDLAGGITARNLRVRCLFELSVEQADEALGDRYFPNTIFLDGKGRAARQRTVNLTRWSEDIALHRAKTRTSTEKVADPSLLETIRQRKLNAPDVPLPSR